MPTAKKMLTKSIDNRPKEITFFRNFNDIEGQKKKNILKIAIIFPANFKILENAFEIYHLS